MQKLKKINSTSNPYIHRTKFHVFRTFFKTRKNIIWNIYILMHFYNIFFLYREVACQALFPTVYWLLPKIVDLSQFFTFEIGMLQWPKSHFIQSVNFDVNFKIIPASLWNFVPTHVSSRNTISYRTIYWSSAPQLGVLCATPLSAAIQPK